MPTHISELESPADIRPWRVLTVLYQPSWTWHTIWHNADTGEVRPWRAAQ
jgi:hypothetical protein